MTITALKQKNTQKGFAMVEMLFYVALFAVLFLAVLNSMLMMIRSFRETGVQSELLQASGIMERISREIKQAQGIDSISTTSLTLDTKDSGGADKTVEFTLSGNDVEMTENSVLTGDLNNPNISVTSLSFTEITTALGKAVKVSLTVVADNDKLNRAKTFYNTIVLRGDY